VVGIATGLWVAACGARSVVAVAFLWAALVRGSWSGVPAFYRTRYFAMLAAHGVVLVATGAMLVLLLVSWRLTGEARLRARWRMMIIAGAALALVGAFDAVSAFLWWF
jgi:hypothetical protein